MIRIERKDYTKNGFIDHDKIIEDYFDWGLYENDKTDYIDAFLDDVKKMKIYGLERNEVLIGDIETQKNIIVDKLFLKIKKQDKINYLYHHIFKTSSIINRTALHALLRNKPIESIIDINDNNSIEIKFDGLMQDKEINALLGKLRKGFNGCYFGDKHKNIMLTTKESKLAFYMHFAREEDENILNDVPSAIYYKMLEQGLDLTKLEMMNETEEKYKDVVKDKIDDCLSKRKPQGKKIRKIMGIYNENNTK